MPYVFDDADSGRTPPGALGHTRTPRFTARVAYGEGTAAGTTGAAQPGSSGTVLPPTTPGGAPGGAPGGTPGSSGGGDCCA